MVKTKRIVETPFSSKNLRVLEKTGMKIKDIVKPVKIEETTYSDKIKIRRLK